MHNPCMSFCRSTANKSGRFQWTVFFIDISSNIPLNARRPCDICPVEELEESSRVLCGISWNAKMIGKVTGNVKTSPLYGAERGR